MTKKRVVQAHHLQYSHPDYKSMQDIIVYVFKGEHDVLTRLQFYTKNSVSRGLIKALKVFIAQREDEAVELRPEENN